MSNYATQSEGGVLACNAKGLGTRGVAPGAKVGDPTEGVGAWTVAMETDATARGLCISHTDRSQWSKKKKQ